VQAVKTDLARWFGAATVDEFKLLRIYRIPFAQPCQQPPTDLRQNPILGDGIFVCGDHRSTATFEGAIISGLDAANAVLSATV
jgi:predicted NAD/FAD-dependent oxidoreductase